jgi:F-type H+-transporting ATPase subunit alpha
MGYMRHSNKETLDTIAGGTWNDDVIAALDAAITKFKQMFLATEDTMNVHDEEAKAREEAEAAEKVTRIVPKPKK